MFRQFLDELNRKSIKIVFSEGKIKYEGPEENITPEIIEKLREHKRSLIRYYWPSDCANIIPVNPLGSKIPFVMIYYEVMNFPLSEYLGKDRPYYGFLHHDAERGNVKFESVESFAADYIVQLQKIIPKGPYYLGGFSFGGVLAYEMAVQLQKAGHEVPFLALLDSKTSLALDPFIWFNSVYRIIKSNILGTAYKKVIEIAQLLTCKLFLFMKKPLPASLEGFYILYKYRELTIKYKPRKYQGDILMFRSSETNPSFQYNGWETYVDKISVVNYEGDHLKIAREKKYAEMIGSEFMRHLEKVNNLS